MPFSLSTTTTIVQYLVTICRLTPQQLFGEYPKKLDSSSFVQHVRNIQLFGVDLVLIFT